MKRLSTHSTFLILIILACAFHAKLFAQEVNSLTVLDAFFEATGKDPESAIQAFAKEGHVTTITYNKEGKSVINQLIPEAYLQEISALEAVYDLKQEPVVMIARSYGHRTTYYFSVYTKLKDKESGVSQVIKSIQTAHLVTEGSNAGPWKITHMSIQNENPYAPFSDDLWPSELVKELKNDLSSGTSLDTIPYDPNKIYTTKTVDLAPEYPGSTDLYETLLTSFDVKAGQVEGYTPFTVVIEEDGQAVLNYVGDLSGEQLTQAKNFVSSMLIWYPALKDEASVKCKMIFSIHE